MRFLFRKTDRLIADIDTFIELLGDTVLHFNEGVRAYVRKNRDDFDAKRHIISSAENRGDEIRRHIELQLYRETLIPESRGDVLGILESADTILDRQKRTMVQFSIEQPVIPAPVARDIEQLIEPVTGSVVSLAAGIRSFFHDLEAVKDHLYRVKHFEKEADRISEEAKRRSFSQKIDLSRKLHLRSFIDHIDMVADHAESVSERIAIAALKRIV